MDHLKSAYRFVTHLPLFDKLFFAGTLLTYIGVTLGNMTRWSIWFDEAFSAYLMRYNFVDIARYTATDVHPPVYYWMLKLWTMLFGTSDLALRLPSMIAILIASIVIVLFVQRKFGVMSARWTAGLLAISPLLVRFGDEARMYGLAVLITSAATVVLVSATEHPSRRKWVSYGILVSLGMWTHYFTAVVWLAHWAWRWIVRNEYRSAKRFFSRDWIMAHIVAVVLFLPWLPFMATQLTTIQGTGFWIEPVTVGTPLNSLSHTFMFLEQSLMSGWLAMALFCLLGIIAVMVWKAGPVAHRKDRPMFLLLTFMAFVPPSILILASMPPLKSSYIDRYLQPSLTWLVVWVAVLVATYLQHTRLRWQSIMMALFVVGVMVFGVTNVYQYGNLNRNAHPIEAQSMKQVIAAIQQKDSQPTPIIADSPWRFYEATQYDSSLHPVYFVAEDDVVFGSYDMLRYSDAHKIKDLPAFSRQHPTIWYVANWYNDEPRMPAGKWRLVETIVGPSPAADASVTRAYKLQAE